MQKRQKLSHKRITEVMQAKLTYERRKCFIKENGKKIKEKKIIKATANKSWKEMRREIILQPSDLRN